MSETSPEFQDRLRQLRDAVKADDHHVAIELGSRLTREHPEHAEAWPLLARAHERSGNHALSLIALHRCVELNPDRKEARSSLLRGNLMMGRSQQLERQLAELERSLQEKPGRRDKKLELKAIRDMAENSLRLGRIEECRNYLDRLAADGFTGPLIMLLQAKADILEKEHERAIATLQSIIDNDRFQPGPRLQAMFELAKVMDREGRYDQAFTLVQRAKSETLVDQAPFDRDGFKEMTDRVIGSFTRERIQALQGSGLGSERPVFIVGMPRSGTTLTEQIIAAHPRCAGIGEQREPLVFAEMISTKTGTPFPECISDTPQSLLHLLGESYLEMIDFFTTDVDRVANKALGLERVLGLMAMILPGSRVVFVNRNPLDNLISTYLHPLNSNRYPWSRRLEDIALVRMEFDRLRAHWKEHLELPIFELDYDRTTVEPEPVIRELIDFLGLEFDESCLRFHESKRLVMTPSFDQVDKPINRNAVDRWRNYEQYLEPVIDLFPS